MEDIELIRLRAALDVEMKRRKLALSVGAMAEQLAIQFFNGTSGRPNLQAAPVGTANVDALSRKGERYSIVKLTRDWSLQAIYEMDWKAFCECRSWDKRMNAWYVGISARTLGRAVEYLPAAS